MIEQNWTTGWIRREKRHMRTLRRDTGLHLRGRFLSEPNKVPAFTFREKGGVDVKVHDATGRR